MMTTRSRINVAEQVAQRIADMDRRGIYGAERFEMEQTFAECMHAGYSKSGKSMYRRRDGRATVNMAKAIASYQ